MCQHWIDTLIPDSLGDDFEATPELDLRLSRLALAGRTDPAARDELLTLLAAKIERFTRRFRRWSLGIWEYDDVLQEGWLTFLDTIHRWTPRLVDGEPAGYLFYFLAVYRLWLSRRITRMLRRGYPPVDPLPDDREIAPDSDTHESDAMVINLLDRVRDGLGEQAGEMLHLRLVADRSVPEIALATGIPRRTAYRRWATIVDFTRREWLEEKAGA
jgi:RNA polymerase sigma factor (sigma-70 family)